ncbi:aspartyl protease family protein [Tenacibaculum sp. M341]|uniref:aspartyl protease family protein n=1 Tax=Tenacibaculum sp. M341 TaxID=2530339 RepID=UPI00104FB019|nr:aspartyl protease family protein [Tenacibaculum sp. M341]TCI91141.1 PDZ domain-containing protein [Tenacibaculum sp. M341]
MRFTILFKITFLLLFELANAQVLELPLEISDRGHTFIKVSVNDSEELNFVFDTGATAEVIDTKVAEKIGVKSEYQQPVQGASGEEFYDIALNEKLKLDTIELVSRAMVIKDLSNLNVLSDEKIDGIIGATLLSKYITNIDYSNKKIVFYKDDNDINLKDFTKIPFTFKTNIPIPLIKVGFTLENGESFAGNVLFDSGAGLSLSVNSPYNKKNKLSEKAEKKLLRKSSGLGAESYDERIRIKTLQLEGFSFTNLPIELSGATEGVLASSDFMGILGAKIIQRFNVVLDYNTKTMYLKPNKTYNNQFEFPLSGVQLKKVNDTIVVNHVSKNSEAYSKGLRENDIIISVNGDSSKRLNIYNSYFKNKGEEIKLNIKSVKGKEKTISFILKELI